MSTNVVMAQQCRKLAAALVEESQLWRGTTTQSKLAADAMQLGYTARCSGLDPDVVEAIFLAAKDVLINAMTTRGVYQLERFANA